MKKTLIIIRAIPGAGKTTLAELIAELFPDAVLCSEDEFWTHPDGSYHYDPATRDEAMLLMLRKACVSVQHAAPIVVVHTAAVDMTDMYWEWLFDDTRDYNYQVFPLILQRNTNNPPSIHEVSDEEMDRFRREMEHELEVAI